MLRLLQFDCKLINLPIMLLRSNLLRFVSILVFGIQANHLSAYQFTSTADTLILETEKIKGHGLFPVFQWSLPLKDISKDNDSNIIFPKELLNPQMAIDIVDTKLWPYRYFMEEDSNGLQKFLSEYYPAKIDTAQLPSKRENHIKILVGNKGTEQVIIVDENNNHDFRDDPVRPVDENGEIDADYIPCTYKIYNGKALVSANTWIVVKLKDGVVKYQIAQHVTANFALDNQTFEISAFSGPTSMRLAYDAPILSLTAQNNIKKDSLLFCEHLKKGEYLQLGEFYYQFADISNGGGKITLIKEPDVSDKIGTQIGFIAPDFQGVTTKGDSIRLANYQGKHLLLTNITPCWSEPMSYEHYKNLSQHYLPKLDILAIDESPNALQVNIEELGLKGDFIISKGNRTIKQNYRQDFCSRTCFLINPNGHIIDKFEIKDWEIALAKHFE